MPYLLVNSSTVFVSSSFVHGFHHHVTVAPRTPASLQLGTPVTIFQLVRLIDSSLRRYFITYSDTLLLYCLVTRLCYSIVFSIYRFVGNSTLLEPLKFYLYVYITLTLLSLSSMANPIASYDF